MRLPAWLFLAAAASVALSCTKHDVVDTAMVLAPRTSSVARAPGSDYLLLAGDMHCHVRPPDDPGHVSLGVGRALELARAEELDFLVLTPHVWASLGESPDLAREALRMHDELRSRIDLLGREGDPVVIAGFEHTDIEYGHLTMAFGDLRAALGADARRPFMERYVQSGGLLVINHPYATPVRTGVQQTEWDLSWRPWTDSVRLPREIRAASRLAQAVEVYNLAVDRLRDGFLLRTPGASMSAALYQLERQIRRQRRRLTPVGGSDTHSEHLRATTFVLARERSEAAIREAILAGRVCVRDAAACSLQVRPAGARTWREVGAAIPADAHSGVIEARAFGRGITLYVDGRRAATPDSGETVRIAAAREECTIIRARVAGGESAPIYVGCDFIR